jgi:hypothetical protein
MNKAPVHCRGDELGEIWWQGREWAVTSDGIECRDGCYFIAKDRIDETRSGDIPDWPPHVATKDWVDIHDFLHRLSGCHCPAWLSHQTGARSQSHRHGSAGGAVMITPNMTLIEILKAMIARSRLNVGQCRSAAVIIGTVAKT